MTNVYRRMVTFLFMLLISSPLFAQNYTISGVVTSAQTGEKLQGANVYLTGTTFGAASDENGKFSITVPKGQYNIVCSFIGFETQEAMINLTNNMEINFELKDYEFSLSVTVISNRAKERETPVAFSNISKRQMETNLGSRDIPLVLNTTPSVFATDNGGGAGDSRINVRGFNQNNVAIMINGVPINDMENGWVYWSNWDGLGDATSSIQVQRGLSAVNLATPSIGGTMNVITDPTQQKAGVSYKNEVGSGNFGKQSLFANTGLIDGKFALTVGGVRKTGDGFVDKAWTDAWAYYFGAAYQLNNTNRFELYAVGAPQKHGQRSYRLNAATFSHDLARELGYSDEILNDPKLREQGLLYNPNWNTITTDYQGPQYYEEYWNVETGERYSPNFIMERENYYHKPIVNFNWYSQLSKDLSLYTTLYWSGGKGGGTGTFGSIRYNTSLLQRVPDWNATLANNRANVVDTLDLDGNGTPESNVISRGILRNSVNQQWTVGAIAKSFYKFSKEFTASFGLDWRLAEIDHYREVRDLLGGSYFYNSSSQFVPNDVTNRANYKKLGDKIDYDNTNKVNWIGGYVQGEYTQDQITAYGTFGYSMISFNYTDHFRTAVANDPSSGQLKLESGWISGFQLKGGASYRVDQDWDVYANAGYVSKVPIFDQVISDVNGTLIDGYENEKFISFEAGANGNLLDRQLSLKANIYYTQWNDRGTSINVRNADGSDGLVRLTGVNATHMGLEFEAAYQPVRFFRFDLAGSIGMWEYTDDVTGTYIKDFTTGETEEYTYYLNGLKVGDAPQTQFALAASIFPSRDIQFQLVWRNYSSYFANFDPFSRTNPDDRAQVWEVPSYSLFDFHFSYDLPIEIGGSQVGVFAHIFNVFDEVFVQDATDNSAFNAYKGNGVNHSADDAEIFPGLPRAFNAGFRVRF